MTPRVGAALLVALATGCGYVGDPQPPSLHIPAPVASLEALQLGDAIRVRFALPDRTIDKLPLGPVGEIDLRFDGQRIAVDPVDAGSVEVRVPAAGWQNRQVRIQVRVASASGKWSEPSAASVLMVVPLVPPPSTVTAKSDPRGVRLAWKAPEGMKVRVSRRNPATGDFDPIDEIAGQFWVDAAAPFGVEQSYVLRTVAQGANVAAESEPTAPVVITPQDEFAPSVPRNLSAVPGLTTIELAWEQSPEADTAGYQVYKAAPGGDLEKKGTPAVAASFSDAAIEAGKTYRYAVSAVDAKGNESARSEPIEVTAP